MVSLAIDLPSRRGIPAAVMFVLVVSTHLLNRQGNAPEIHVTIESTSDLPYLGFPDRQSPEAHFARQLQRKWIGLLGFPAKTLENGHPMTLVDVHVLPVLKTVPIYLYLNFSPSGT